MNRYYYTPLQRLAHSRGGTLLLAAGFMLLVSFLKFGRDKEHSESLPADTENRTMQAAAQEQVIGVPSRPMDSKNEINIDQ